MRDLLRADCAAAAAVIYSAMAEAPETTPSTAPLEWLKRSNAFPNYVAYVGVEDKIAELRKHKDRGEIERIRHATEASIAGHRAAMKAMRPGLYEYQIAALMQYKFQDGGCERPAYAPIVGAGFDSTVLHYSEDSHQIHDGDVVLMDVAGEYAMYASDITRTLPANGHFTARQREIYNVVLGAQRAAMQAVVAGKSVLSGAGPDSLVPGRLRLHQHPWQGSARRAAGEILHSRTGASGGIGGTRRGLRAAG